MAMIKPTTRWLPLESNPEVMNKYAKTLGINESWQFVDIFAFEPDILKSVPRPVAAVLLLYPHTEKSDSFGEVDSQSGLYFMKQTIGNACGTIGIIHALCNNFEKLGFDTDKHLSKFFIETKDLSPEERGKHLGMDAAFGEAHEEVALEGQTRALPRTKKVDFRFVTFVHHKGILYELDGHKAGPVKHGPTSEDTLLEDTTEVVKKFMAREPDNLKFTVVALAKA